LSLTSSGGFISYGELREVDYLLFLSRGFSLCQAGSPELHDEPDAPAELLALGQVAVLRTVWQRHYAREEKPAPPNHSGVRLKAKEELSRADDAIESPYDTEARFRRRDEKTWTGYIVHWSESCDEALPHLITHVKTTRATVHEASCTESIHQGLADKDLLPDQHLVDSAYIDAELLVKSQKDHNVTLIGPARLDSSWQKRSGGYDASQITIDWEHRHATCPQGKLSVSWREDLNSRGVPGISILFAKSDCLNCDARTRCTQAKKRGRGLWILPQEPYEALQQARKFIVSDEGKELFKQRAGIEGTISQGVRGFGLRKTRYWGLAKTHLQHVATAAAINLDRIIGWLDGKPLEATRTSRFAALAVGGG
jgi:transposase